MKLTRKDKFKLLFFFSIFFIMVFLINYSDKHHYQEVYRKGFKGKINLIIDNMARGQSSAYYDSISYFQERDFLEEITDVKIGDSVYKEPNSKNLDVYRMNQDSIYEYYRSFTRKE